jgi:hypothetical protein
MDIMGELMTLSIKDRLEARAHVGQIMSFSRLFKIIKSLGYTLYIESEDRCTIIGSIKEYRYPHYVKIMDIFERENQIWSMGEMIMATVVRIEGVK